jgi:hypothetical protein
MSMPIRAGKDISTPEIGLVSAGSRVLQPGLPLKKKGCMRVCLENRLLPSVQGWVTPIGRAGNGGKEVRYLQLMSLAGPLHAPQPLPHPPSSCRPTTRIHGIERWQHIWSPAISADDDDIGPTILGRKEPLSDTALIATAKTNEQASKRVGSRYRL